MIKIDVESFEFFSICGAEETIKKFRPVIFYEDIEDTKPTDYMLSVVFGKTKQKYDEFWSQVIGIFLDIIILKDVVNYLAKFDIFSTD